MTDKITLSSLPTTVSVTTSGATINANNSIIQTAFDNTLSRDGTQPNTMLANLDMNSKHILNLPSPSSSNEPARLIDVATLAAGGTVTFNAVPVGGTVGQLLTKNSSANYDTSWAGIGANLQTFQSNIRVGNGSFSSDDTAILANRALTPVSGLLNSHAYRDETIATQAVTGGAFSGYASFDAAAVINGTATTAANHFRQFQARGAYNSTGTLNEFAGLWVGLTMLNGTTPAMYGVHVVTPTISGGGVVTNNYAYYADTLSGATNSYFLFGGSNPSVLNGNFYVGGRVNQLAQEISNIQFNGASQEGLLFADTVSTAGNGTHITFYRNNVNVGFISSSLTTTTFSTSSDERKKNFIGAYDPKKAIDIIKADPVRDFTWKLDGSYSVGWGAQTSYEVSPDLAYKPEDETKDWAVDHGKRTPYLWAAMSNVLDRLETLEKKYGTEA